MAGLLFVYHSKPFTELLNICRTAKDHRKHCDASSCAVSLWTLKGTAERLFDMLSNQNEKAEARLQIDAVVWL